MAETLEVYDGTDAAWTIALRDTSNRPLLRTYTGTETLTLQVWTGERVEAESMASSTVEWADADAGTITLHLDRADVSALDYGLYWLQVLLADGPDVLPCYQARIHVQPGPATLGAGETTRKEPVYGTLGDIYEHCPWINTAIEATPTLASDLRSQRAHARRHIDELILSRAREVLETQYARHAPIVVSEPITPTTGADAGPRWGPSILPNTTIRDQLDAIRADLDDDKLMVDVRLKEAAARFAIAIALEYQVGQTPEGSTYQDYARTCQRFAWSILRGYVARIDTDADGVADYEIP